MIQPSRFSPPAGMLFNAPVLNLARKCTAKENVHLPTYRGTRPLVEAAAMVGLTVAITLLSAYLPLLGLVTVLFVPLPLIVLEVRHGLRLTLIAVVAAAALSIAFLGVADGLGLAGGFWLIGVAYGFAIRRRLSALGTYLIGAIGVTAAALATWAAAKLILGQDLVAQAGGIAGEAFKQFIQTNGSRLTPAQVGQVQQQAAMISDLTHRYALALLVASSLVLALIEYLLAAWFLPRLGLQLSPFPAFGRWQLPLMPILLVWATSLVILSAQERFPALGPLAPVAGSLFSLCSVAFIIEGLAVAYHYLTILRVPGFLRVLLILFLGANPFTGKLALWFGIFDYLFDYRRFRTKSTP